MEGTTPKSAHMPLNAGVFPVFGPKLTALDPPAKTIVSDFAPICKTDVKIRVHPS